MTFRALAIAWKELVQLRRDRLTVAMMFLLPLVQLLLFGFAINTDVRHIRTVVVDDDRSAESRDLVEKLEATGFYDVVAHVAGYDAIARAFRSGKARVALVVPPDYAKHVVRGPHARVQLVVDGSDPLVVSSSTNTAAALVASDHGSSIELEPSILYNPDLRTAVYIVPGLVGVILTMTMVMLTAMALARERERGTLEQLIVSPVKPIELVVGKILPYIGLGYVQMTIILVVGRVVFDVPFRGSVALLYALAFVFIAASLAIGLTFSTLAKTQQQAMQMSFFFLLPNILLSGFMFPIDAMPGVARAASNLLPLTHFLQVVRGIVLKGSGLSDMVGELAWLIGILVALVGLSSLRFRKKLA